MRPADRAISLLNENGYRNVQLDSQTVESVPPNTVIWQEPVPGAASFGLATNGLARPRPPSVRDRIRLVVSAPPVNQGRVVPDVRNWRTLDALIHLRVLGLPAVLGDPTADPRETFVGRQVPDPGIPVEQLDNPTVLLDVRPYPVVTQVRVDTVRDTVTVTRLQPTSPASPPGLPLPTAIGLATAVLALGIVTGYAGTTSGWLRRPGRSPSPPPAPEKPAEAPAEKPPEAPDPAARLRLPQITTAIVDEAVWVTKKRVSRVEVTKGADR